MSEMSSDEEWGVAFIISLIYFFGREFKNEPSDIVNIPATFIGIDFSIVVVLAREMEELRWFVWLDFLQDSFKYFQVVWLDSWFNFKFQIFIITRPMYKKSVDRFH